MFRLHGSRISNFYNMVALALMEKGLAFDEIPVAPSQKEPFLAISPMGKIPILEINEGYLTETVVILEFLEDVYPEIPLYPSDPFKRALVRRQCHMAEIYIDLPMRPIMGLLLAQKALPSDQVPQYRNLLKKALKAYSRVARPDPWLAGADFGVADIFAYYSLKPAAQLANRYLDVDIYADLPGFKLWNENMAKRAFVAEVDRSHQLALKEFTQLQKK